MTVALFAMLLAWPFWMAAVPAVLLTHRIGVMMHEYIHGIPFRRYANCLRVLAIYDGMTFMFGLLELFRATHLSHHRWLNSPGDSGFDNLHVKEHPNQVMGTIAALEVTQHLKFYWEALHGLHPYARPRRIAFGFVTSCAWIVFWIAVGRPDMVWKLMAADGVHHGRAGVAPRRHRTSQRARSRRVRQRVPASSSRSSTSTATSTITRIHGCRGTGCSGGRRRRCTGATTSCTGSGSTSGRTWC